MILHINVAVARYSSILMENLSITGRINRNASRSKNNSINLTILTIFRLHLYNETWWNIQHQETIS